MKFWQTMMKSYSKPFQYYLSCTDVLSARPNIQQKYEQCLFDQGISLFIGILHAHMEPHAVITYCCFRFYYFSDANLDTNLIFQRVTFRLAIAINTVVFSKIGCILTCTLSFWITSQNGTKCLILKICFNWGIQEQWIMTTAFFFKKMTQINFVSGNQLHITLNSCQHLNFGLSWPG